MPGYVPFLRMLRNYSYAATTTNAFFKLYTLYLDDANFKAVAQRLYVNPSTTSSLVRAALGFQLQQAARNELLKTSQYIDVAALEGDAQNAFEALLPSSPRTSTFSAGQNPACSTPTYSPTRI